MAESTEKFILDANSLITPYESFYPFDLAGNFWSQLAKQFNTGSIILLDMVKNEVMTGDDDLSKWVESLSPKIFIDHRQLLITQKYSEVIEYINNNPNYQENALHEWSRNSVADAWIIAAAMANDFTVITFENSNRGLNSHNPSKEAKIPDVCKVFNVRVNNLYYMMRTLGIKM